MKFRADERELIDQAARATGETMASFIRGATIPLARRVVAEETAPMPTKQTHRKRQ